ncbi:MAG TPA: DinB family protein, partial [Thermoanaerobaculia bacterium]|nr:DinB family protein [Thermoanaerobaculia bacterium]
MAIAAGAARELLLYMLWADRLMLAAVREVRPEDLKREAGVSFGSLLGTMAHSAGVQRLWLARLSGNPL